jgi:hypothetical protein
LTFDGEKLILKDNLIDFKDFVILPVSVWNYLLAWYGLDHKEHAI